MTKGCIIISRRPELRQNKQTADAALPVDEVGGIAFEACCLDSQISYMVVVTLESQFMVRFLKTKHLPFPTRNVAYWEWRIREDIQTPHSSTSRYNLRRGWIVDL